MNLSEPTEATTSQLIRNIERDLCNGQLLWDSRAMQTAAYPEFTVCFQQTILVWVPVAHLVFFSPFLLYKLCKRRNPPLPSAWLNLTKLVFIVLAIATSLVRVAFSIYEGEFTPNTNDTTEISVAEFIAQSLIAASMLWCYALMVSCKVRGISSSGVLFTAFLLFTVCGIPELCYHIRLIHDNRVHLWLNTVAYLVYYFCTVLQFLLQFPADRTTNFVYNVSDQNASPEKFASVASRVTFEWVAPLVYKGWKNPLELPDVWDLNENNRSVFLMSQWDKYWQPAAKNFRRRKLKSQEQNSETLSPSVYYGHRNGGDTAVRIVASNSEKISNGNVKRGSSSAKQKAKPLKEPSIALCLIRCFKAVIAYALLVDVIGTLLQFVNPQILSLLIDFVNNPNLPAWQGYSFALLMLISTIAYTLINNQFWKTSVRLSMDVRTILTSAIFSKALKLSNSARKHSTVGEIVNLMSVDTTRIQTVVPFLNLMWMAPLQVSVAVYFLWELLGPSVFAGLGAMLLLMPFNALIASMQHKLQDSQMKYKDERVKLINEILNGMKVLKLYAWEPPFEQQIFDIRDRELKVLRKAQWLEAFENFLWVCVPFLMSAVTFGTFILSDPKNVLTPQLAFVSLSLLNLLRFPLSILPPFITWIIKASVSIKRLRAFLLAEEVNPKAISHDDDGVNAIIIRDGVFTWDREQPDLLSLKNINVTIPKGSLVAVVGQVGTGKSSLLSAILGEMDKLSGHANVVGSIAYVPQQAWIQNATLKENITFSKALTESAYQAVIGACALGPDLQVLPGGDKTEIGEKGINLSGGQKQRISLARAVYQNADCYLLDDPLSAVDAHVGKHIFAQVISNKGMLKHKTRILVTHGIHFLKEVDCIIVMINGEISEMGTYSQLLKQQGAFGEFVETYLLENATKPDITDDEGSLMEEVMGDLDNLNPGLRKRLVSQMSHKSAGSLKDQSQQKQETLPKSHQLAASQQHLLQLPASPDHLSAQLRRPSRAISVTELALIGNAGEEPAIVDAANASSLWYESAAPGRQTSTLSFKEDQREKQKSLAKLMPQFSKTKENAANAENSTLIEQETAETGSVKFRVYIAYFKAVGYGFCWLILVLFFSSQALNLGANTWLAEWASDSLRNGTVDDEYRLIVFCSLGFAQGILILFACLTFTYAIIFACRSLHAGMMRNLMRSPLSFFEVTPLGRIMNRCTRDIENVDNVIPHNFLDLIICLIQVVGSIILILANTPIFGVAVAPLGLLYYFVQKFYVATSRQLKRLESISRSPIYSQFQETLNGVSSIRAYKAEDKFIKKSEQRIDVNQSTFYINIMCNRWLSIRLDVLSDFIIFFTALFAVLSREAIGPGIAGLIISSALTVCTEEKLMNENIIGPMNWCVRQLSELEMNIVAVERITEYSERPTEAPWTTASKPGKDWPMNGGVQFTNLAVRYRPELDFALRDVHCTVLGGEKIGIVGRTGAGKSSLTLCLFRIIEAAKGQIIIDGINIANLGLHDLRSRLTIIPQDPVLFSGTMRTNLDPFSQCSDDQLWVALEHAHLKDFVASLPEQLEHTISEAGENLSVGQRQLVCLARALLRKTKLLILDEATAAVDLETDDLIQNTIRQEFRDATVLTIAHRLNTILDSTRVMVLDAGRIIEMDSPQSLLSNEDSAFYKMAKDAGLVT